MNRITMVRCVSLTCNIVPVRARDIVPKPLVAQLMAHHISCQPPSIGTLTGLQRTLAYVLMDCIGMTLSACTAELQSWFIFCGQHCERCHRVWGVTGLPAMQEPILLCGWVPWPCRMQIYFFRFFTSTSLLLHTSLLLLLYLYFRTSIHWQPWSLHGPLPSIYVQDHCQLCSRVFWAVTGRIQEKVVLVLPN